MLSVHQSDIIVYGADLRTYLLHECADLLGLDPEAAREEALAGCRCKSCSLPFWGDFLR